MNFLWYILFVIPSLRFGTGADYLNITQYAGNYSQLMSFVLNKNSEHFLIFPTSASKYPYRVEAWSTTAAKELPILLVVRQEKQVLSWQIPFIVQTSKRKGNLYFLNTSRTLCHNNMGQITRMMTNHRPFASLSQNFVISFSTSSTDDVDIFIKVEEQRNFYVQNGVSYLTSVSPSQPQYYFYSFNGDTHNAVVDISTDTYACLIVSIQDSSCPVFDLDSDITYDGQFQTVNRKAGITIRWSDYPDGFFLVFVAKGDNYDCIEQHNLNSHRALYNRNSHASNVTFSINKGISGGDYAVAAGITMGTIAGFYVIAVTIAFAFYRWGTISKFTRSDDEVDSTDRNRQSLTIVTSSEMKRQLLLQNQLTLDQLSRTVVRSRSSNNYVLHVSNIALFYGIPVIQLVVTYQRVSNTTGDKDMCYYNFLCANPLGFFDDFNHIFSNIGYVFMGMLFILMVFWRHRTVQNITTGVPMNNGIFYAMGIALIMEGVLSACYHVCPSRSNFQY